MPPRKPPPLDPVEQARIYRRWAQRVEAGNAAAVRRSAGLSADRIGKALGGIDPTSVLAWEKGQHRPRDPRVLRDWLDLLDVLEAARSGEDRGQDQGEDPAELRPTGTEGGGRAAT